MHEFKNVAVRDSREGQRGSFVIQDGLLVLVGKHDQRYKLSCDEMAERTSS